MDATMKEKLLSRKFSSIQYMEEMSKYHRRSLDAMNKALQYFYDHPPAEDWHTWHRSSWPEIWEQRARPNFERMQKYIDIGIKQYLSRLPSYYEIHPLRFLGHSPTI